MTTGTNSTLTTDERLAVPGAEFQFDKDGDLEIEIINGGNGRWEGVYLNREDAMKLKNFLQRTLP